MAQRSINARDNYILAKLPPNEYQILKPWLEPAAFNSGDVLAFAGQGMEYFYFVTHGIVSLSNATSNGESIEIAMVGPEGAIGLCALFGENSVSLHKSAQSKQVYMQRIPVARMKQVLDRCHTLSGLLHSFMFKQMMHISQNLVCSHFHTIEQQLCKWILLREKRMDGILHVTQDKIAQMLGVRRAGINVAIRRLQNDGLIASKRGLIQVQDRRGLNKIACECYNIIQSEYDRMFENNTSQAS